MNGGDYGKVVLVPLSGGHYPSFACTALAVWLAIGRHVNSSRQVPAIFHDMNCETLAFRLAL